MAKYLIIEGMRGSCKTAILQRALHAIQTNHPAIVLKEHVWAERIGTSQAINDQRMTDAFALDQSLRRKRDAETIWICERHPFISEWINNRSCAGQPHTLWPTVQAPEAVIILTCSPAEAAQRSRIGHEKNLIKDLARERDAYSCIGLREAGTPNVWNRDTTNPGSILTISAAVVDLVLQIARTGGAA